ncbi:MerR family transcriptional regulator [Nocardioides kribbensis]|uniref:MerR family transcriptional regulator n=1 Tax=Nocardioides kribbensis TaxID=305517 RepID=UPI0029D41439|nr:MerR family transcriptional regulator [Nocardioides kribbensis]
MSEETAGPAADPSDPIPETRAMHIGEVATRTDLSLRSLRHWDEVGLLRPSGRTDGGFRLYTERDVERILLIRRMKPLGFSLEEMGAALADLDLLAEEGPGPDTGPGAPRAAARERLAAVQAEAAARREKLVRQLAMADEFLDLLGRHLP